MVEEERERPASRKCMRTGFEAGQSINTIHAVRHTRCRRKEQWPVICICRHGRMESLSLDSRVSQMDRNGD